MRQQYKASYLCKDVFASFSSLRKNSDFKFKILGLLESIATFDTSSTMNLENPEYIPSLLAISNNIITRGNPTICSEYVSSRLRFLSHEFTDSDFYNALHLVDVRDNVSEFFNADLESNFERAFLNNHIPENKKYLCQFFQHQREKKTLTNEGNDGGRVDFSFEAPYFKEVKKETIYRKEKEIKERTVLIIEVDGKAYHQNLIDDIRDYETARFGHTTKRITETNTKKDTKNLIAALSRSDYFKTIEGLFQRDFEQLKNLQTFVLAPIAIARLHKVINQFIINKYDELKANNQSTIYLAILERDIPCGQLAVDDLNLLYNNLIGLENKQAFIPKIEVTVFADRHFSHENLQKLGCKFNTDDIIATDYDLVIDIAILWRTGTFVADLDFQNSENSVTIRSSHYTDYNCSNEVYCSNNVVYRDLVLESGNEQHTEIKEATPYIEYFLRNIFGKATFRKGQLPILNRALKNKTVIGLLPTGGGKSLTYQLAALLQPGITIIIDPIRSLMVDQYEGLLSIGIDRCDFINSILSTEERIFAQQKILPAGKTQFLFCSPERLAIQEFRDSLNKTNIEGYYFSYCVIDEAHCVSEWGHDFRTPYLNLGENAIKYCKTIDSADITIFGLTATASFDVLSDIERELKISQDDGKAIIRYENTVRDELNYQIHPIAVSKPEDAPQNWIPDKYQIGKEKIRRTETIIKSINSRDRLLSKYNNVNVYSKILDKTFNDYLPIADRNSLVENENDTVSSKESNTPKSKEVFIKSNSERIILKENQDLPFHQDEHGKFNYGIIVFCPHKTSELGVETFLDSLRSENDKIVFFKGSGNTLDKDEQDKASFKNLSLFKENEASVMIATKAFGMGIDKPNVRLTIHANISSSIESFVQETGRAGRDGKASLSIVLYNNQIERDRQVLDNFYKTSFKGADKERSVIWELRNRVFFPNINNLQLLAEKLSEAFNEVIKIKLGGITKGKDGAPDKDWTNTIFITTAQGVEIGRINIADKTPSSFLMPELASEYLTIITSFIPNFQNSTAEEITFFFNTMTENIQPQKGLEQILNDVDSDCSIPIAIPFKNMFYSKDDSGFDIIDEFAFEKHFNYFKISRSIQNLLIKIIIKENELKDKFRSAIKWENTFEAFVSSLHLKDEDSTVLISDAMLRVRYYIPRNQDDTAKAIYRLTSIGIIDTYTIEYQQKLYKVTLSKKNGEKYFDNYQRLIERYTSRQEAIKLRQECKDDFDNSKNVTEISKCLEHLTNFIYDKIADKRKRAINDMVGLCEETILISDPIQQSEKIKENIYYYFNAKYARELNTAKIQNGKTIDADLKADFLDGLSINETIWKYIEQIIDYDDNGSIINNIKHLRGATMRMLRGTSGAPQFNILKAYSLYILSSTSPQLIKEAIEELKSGISKWHEIEPDNFNFEDFLLKFKSNLNRHLDYVPDEIFGDIDDHYYTIKNLMWLKKFNLNFLKDYSNALRTSN